MAIDFLDPKAGGLNSWVERERRATALHLNRSNLTELTQPDPRTFLNVYALHDPNRKSLIKS